MEIEIKLGPLAPEQARAAYEDTALLPPAGAEERIPMTTVYYDTPAGDFAARKLTLRLRQEGEARVCTFKAPVSGLCRQELECPAGSIEEGAAALRERADLPPECRPLLAGPFVPVCGAEFVRTTRLCRAGEVTFHLCRDEGWLENGSRRVPLCELELELVSGPQKALEGLAEALSARYALPRCTRSKQARALALGQEDER